MKTIIFNSQKGGSGKTTLCANVAIAAERAGDGPVYLIDTDPQGTLTIWHEKRQAERPRRVELPHAGIAEGLTQLRDLGAAWCFIDTAPSRAEETLLQLADFVIVPIRPSPSDLWAASATVRILREHKIDFLFVVNQAKPNAAITMQAVTALSHRGRVAETVIGDRVSYAAAFTDGRTALELDGKSAAAIETAALWAHIKAGMLAPAER